MENLQEKLNPPVAERARFGLIAGTLIAALTLVSTAVLYEAFRSDSYPKKNYPGIRNEMMYRQVSFGLIETINKEESRMAPEKIEQLLRSEAMAVIKEDGTYPLKFDCRALPHGLWIWITWIEKRKFTIDTFSQPEMLSVLAEAPEIYSTEEELREYWKGHKAQLATLTRHNDGEFLMIYNSERDEIVWTNKRAFVQWTEELRAELDSLR